jgi:hypothetical protein
MGDRIDFLFQEWHQLGGKAMVAEVDRSITPRRAEEVIAESTAHCRESGRLTWIVLDWLIHHIDQTDEQALVQLTKSIGDLSVLGVICDAANLRNSQPKLQRIMQACDRPQQLETFFKRVANSPLASKLARENAVDVFRRWNYLSNELRYL